MIKEGGNTKLALEVNFYSGTRDLYDAEAEKDDGGLYALNDGMGMYQGSKPVAGPCPVDIICSVESTVANNNCQTFTGRFTTSEHVANIMSFFKKYAGHGGRPLRVSGLDGQLLLMYNCPSSNVNELSFVQSSVDIHSNVTESVGVIVHKLVIVPTGTFIYTKISDNLSLNNRIDSAISWTVIE